jgi:metal-responsive CopG/Arc/MetJ family transcriptional regulator
MTRTQIYLPEELLLESKLFSQSQNVNLSEFIRTAIKNYITQQAKGVTTNNQTKFSKIRTFKPSKPLTKNLKPEEISKEIDKIVYGK